MKEQLVSFQVAKLAKEKGFTVKCLNKFYDLAGEMQMQYGSGKYWMDEEGEEWQPEILGCTHTGIGKRTITNTYERPTQSLLQKWLREKYNIYIFIYTMESLDGLIYFDFGIKQIINWLTDKSNKPNNFKTYEEALEEGLKESLKLI